MLLKVEHNFQLLLMLMFWIATLTVSIKSNLPRPGTIWPNRATSQP